jgi:hypothetical protein
MQNLMNKTLLRCKQKQATNLLLLYNKQGLNGHGGKAIREINRNLAG